MQRNSCVRRPKRPYTVQHSDEMLKLALECLRSKQMSSYDAERHFGIPRRTLLDKLRGKHQNNVGRPTRLLPQEEDQIIKVLIAAAEYGCPLTMLDLRIVVHKYLERCGKNLFNGAMPGEKWAYGFLKRHSRRLSLRITSNIKKARAEKTCDEMRGYFDNLKETLKDVPNTNVLNYDETNLSDDPGKAKCIVKRGVKYPERIINSTKGSISIMFAVTAAGEFLPPYVVYRAKNLWTQWVVGGPSDAKYNKTESGWFDTLTFEDWFTSLVIPWAKSLSGPKIVLGDNLASHLNPNVVNLCEEHNIRFAFLPTNSTHLTQPLDVCVYAPLKRMWRKILTDHKIEHPAEKALNKTLFPGLLSKLMDKLVERKENVLSAFATTGIYPFDPERVLQKLPDYKQVSDYGVDQAVVDYLKTVRSPTNKEKLVPLRNKKVKIEPGKSVSAHDFTFSVNLDFKINNQTDNVNRLRERPTDHEQKVKILSNIVLKSPMKNFENKENSYINNTEIQNPTTSRPPLTAKLINSTSVNKPKISCKNNLHQRTFKKKVISPIKKSHKEDTISDEDSDAYSVHDSTSEYENEENRDVEEGQDTGRGEQEINNSKEDSAESYDFIPKNPEKGDYLLVKFNIDRGNKYYVGKVIMIEGKTNYKVKFLRHKGQGKFAWPINDDYSVVYKTDIEEILPAPTTERRGLLNFDITKWCNYNIG